MIARRKLLTMLGLGTLAGPSVAQELTQNLYESGTALGSSFNNSPSPSSGQFNPVGCPEIPRQFQGPLGRQAFLATFGTPPAVEEYFRQEAARNANSTLDTDLYAARSFSLAGRIAIQRERNYHRYHQNWVKDLSSGKNPLRDVLRSTYPWMSRFLQDMNVYI